MAALLYFLLKILRVWDKCCLGLVPEGAEDPDHFLHLWRLRILS